jgi:LuxR family transcriptional regulator, quorum-sensing system regulator LasR
MQRAYRRRPSSGGGQGVTAREIQVLIWIAAGKSDWAIGRILKISGKTVNFHVENAKRKFGVGTRVQAVVAAIRKGVIPH